MNKQPEVPENQTAWNSNNHGIKETNRITRPVTLRTERNLGEGEDHGGGRLRWRDWLKGNWDSEVAVGQLPWWEKLLVSQEISLKSALQTSQWATLFPLWPLPHRQHHNTARRFALPGWISKAPSPYNLSGTLNKEIGPKWKTRAKLQKKS